MAPTRIITSICIRKRGVDDENTGNRVRGQLGHDIVQEATKHGIEAVGVDVQEMDITDQEIVHRVIKEGHYDAVVHCAAWTAVDKAEEMKDLVYKVNVLGVQYIADVCRELDIPMMFFSTDYVFDGEGTTP